MAPKSKNYHSKHWGLSPRFVPRFLGSVPTFEAEQTRRQVIGDAAVVDKGIATGWADVFAEEGERFFASFAIPGLAEAFTQAKLSDNPSPYSLKALELIDKYFKKR